MTTDLEKASAGGSEEAIMRGRFVATPPPGTIVFMFGMRVNRWGEVRHWLPLWRSLRRMIRQQRDRPQSGMLWSTSWRDGREITVLQYWRDMETLMAYAQDKTYGHAHVWKKYNHGIGDTGEVGIWHEAYAIDPETPGRLHTIYRDVPKRGLAAATELADAEEAALRRINRKRT